MNHLEILMVIGFAAVAIPFGAYAARVLQRVLPMPGENDS